MTTKCDSAQEKLRKAEADCRQAAEMVLPLALTSLYHTALYACLLELPDTDRLIHAVEEQVLLAGQITRAGLIPFDDKDRLDARMAWLNDHAGRMAERSALLARYAELHALRDQYLPTRN